MTRDFSYISSYSTLHCWWFACRAFLYFHWRQLLPSPRSQCSLFVDVVSGRCRFNFAIDHSDCRLLFKLWGNLLAVDKILENTFKTQYKSTALEYTAKVEIIADRYHLITSLQVLSSFTFFFFSILSLHALNTVCDVLSVLWHWCSAWLPMSASHFSAMCKYSTAVVSLYVGGDARKV